ncbi:MAG TPA: hypothetical protein VLJ60_04160 [bacterium]|nr:hypothetical protein [bacterium]
MLPLLISVLILFMGMSCKKEQSEEIIKSDKDSDVLEKVDDLKVDENENDDTPLKEEDVSDEDSDQVQDFDPYPQYKECPERKYYKNHVGFLYMYPEIFLGVKDGMFEEPVHMTINSINERIIEDKKGDYLQISFSGRIPVSKEYIERENFNHEEIEMNIYLRNFGKIKDENILLGKSIEIKEDAFFYSTVSGEMNLSSSTLFRMAEKLFFAEIKKWGQIGFKNITIDLDELMPELSIVHDLDSEYEVCKRVVQETRKEEYYDILYFPDISVKCNNNGEKMSMKEGTEYSFCGFKFFITDSIAVAKGIDDDGSVGLTGNSSYFTMYIVNEEILQK